ncbi:SigE family RNA polymerase sigma factor [Actinoplanes sp. TRM 88003]|uniref:SigE family RNA polymerase sigma factor n=1 Tax=Paractinoplanes aksuensis TaxID=2939490 RepID=A0ABT1DGR4_9ACTN|nr:SigE family RNA polymerase sigma factor [Actinoplanes aksuensis]MCO8270017.1 SigE family RNA polymerase sigma factor [Actinoplanes aksuensis]
MGFDDFVRSRSTGLLRVAYLLTGDRHAAEDLLQEVLEQMYVRWRRIHGAPEAYARRALVNRATNRWRSRARRPETPLDAQHEQPGPDHGEDVALRSAVLDALRELPAKQRAAVVLRYLDDLPVHEVAAALGCSEGTVKSNASRGLERLRQALAIPEGVER